MKRFLLLSFLAFILLRPAFPQHKYWVSFRDKAGVSFDPYSWFDARTIMRRKSLGIPLVMESDLPLNLQYVQAVNAISPVSSQSRWLNAVSLTLTPKQMEKVRSLPFVSAIRPEETHAVRASEFSEPGNKGAFLVRKQTAVMGSRLFADAGYDGSGIRIAVLDAGFPGVDTLPEFRKMRAQGRIIDTWDFVKKRKDVFGYNPHGTAVLACIGGEIDSLAMGMATGAEFLLARTEVNAEVFSEEENWFAAIEWADRKGADIISSSLGYTFNRYFPRQMDGKTTFVSRMANLAARKGLLVINAAGNDGDNDWEVIGAPADADSVLTVGGIDSETGIHISFSSFGPTSDGRLKPNVSAFGEVYTTNRRGGLDKEYGTSFATPLVTGFAACVMQMHPDWNNMKVFREIEKSGHLFPYYDYAHGYGVPQASCFLGEKREHSPTFTTKREFSFLTVTPLPEDSPVDHHDQGKKIKIVFENGNKRLIVNNDTVNVVNPENKLVAGLSTMHVYDLDRNYLYYHFADKQTGRISYYAVVDIGAGKRYSIDLDRMKQNEILMMHYRGYTTSYSN